MRLAIVVALAVTLAGCAAAKPMHGMPSSIDRGDISPIATWAGTPVLVEEGRPSPPEPLRVSLVDRGLTWESYSTAVVQETRRALLDALGPARVGAPAELRVTIREHTVRFSPPNWVGSTVLEAEILRAGQPTEQRWTARAQDVRWNWMRLGTAMAANQKAYEAAVQDLLRQLALSRPPQ